MDPVGGIGMTSRRTRLRLVARLRDRGIGDEAVLTAMLEVPRHLFVEEALASRAYEDTALPIGFGQTISQPYVVARMTELLLAGGIPQRVLEVGSGSGYQAAVLARLVPRVVGVERIERLAQRARSALESLKMHNVQVHHGDGFLGRPQEAPFGAILLAAAPASLPEALLQQLAPGGRLVAPLGEGRRQRLILVERRGHQFVKQELDPVTFVPLVSGVT